MEAIQPQRVGLPWHCWNNEIKYVAHGHSTMEWDL